ncbi:hypothetical protein CgunFtcFv8_026263 [Champsocephalus gunnari]|uniref:Uncharacterized protein n=1 Tax=Champsocephalus gunnari TaxID=52237 RepID=A0AAN8CD65_CHAGU|nr:hypothetical protein CgunFtcFv8_026263 [Champsocephalus gunnari]
MGKERREEGGQGPHKKAEGEGEEGSFPPPEGSASQPPPIRRVGGLGLKRWVRRMRGGWMARRMWAGKGKQGEKDHERVGVRMMRM